MSRAGAIAGRGWDSDNNNGSAAFTWTPTGGRTDVDGPISYGTWGLSRDMNSNGVGVGTRANGQAFVVDANGVTELAPLPGYEYGNAVAVSESGLVVGSSSRFESTNSVMRRQSFLRRPDGTTVALPERANLEQINAIGVNSTGLVAGTWGNYSSSFNTGFDGFVWTQSEGYTPLTGLIDNLGTDRLSEVSELGENGSILAILSDANRTTFRTVVLTPVGAPVPEPATLGVFGLAALTLLRRRKARLAPTDVPKP